MMQNIDYTDPFAVEQAKAQASLLRAQQNREYKAPQAPGMVGRVYVGAHPMQGLAEVLRNYEAGKEEKAAMQQLQGIGAQRQEAQNRDMSAFVQALRGTPAQPAFEAAGPAPQGAPQEGGYMVPAQAAKAGDPYAAYSQAMTSQSPMVRQMGMQGMAQLPQLEQAKAEREANRAWQEQQRELDRQMRRDIAQQNVDLRREVRNAGAQKVDLGKTLPTGEVDKITGLDESLGAQQRLMETFKPEYGNYGSDFIGGVVNTVGAKFSDKLQPQAEWWAAQEANDNIMRNKLFGASLTAGEQKAWDKTSIKPGMSDTMIAERMKERADLIEAQRNTRIQNLERAGYNVANFGKPTENFVKPKPAEKPLANPQDAAALQWAKSNPNDPRAAQILQRLGVQ